MNNMKKHLLTSGIITSLITSVAIAQFNFNVSFNHYIDDNLFRTPDPIQDQLSNYQIGTNLRFKDSGLSIYDNFNALNYKDNENRSFMTNKVGFSNRINWGDNSLSSLYFGANWNLRINQSDFEYYNYSQFSGFVNTQIFPKFFILKGGYSYRWCNYLNWTDLSNHLHNAYVQINKSLPTRTTFIAEIGYGEKSFLGTDTISTTITNGRGNGRHSGTITEITDEIDKALNTSQLNFTFRITQSLKDNIGLYIQYYKQYSIDDEISYSNFDDYYQDDELFDDPFTYESDEYSSQITWILPQLSKIIIHGAYAYKNYISEITYVDENDTTGTDILRADTQIQININFSKTFKIEKYWINSINFNLNYSHIINDSNTYWYNYKSSVFNAGLKVNF